MGGHTIGKGCESAQPLELLFTELFDRLPPIGTTDDRTNHKNHDIHELVAFVSLDPRVHKRRKMFLNACCHEKLLKPFLAIIP